MKFYLDGDLSDEVAVIARGLGVDAISAHEGGRERLEDVAQLEFAAAEGRCLVTCNRNDFLNITTMFYERELPHAGILVVTWALRRRGFARIAAALAEYDRQHPEGVFPYTFGYLGQGSR